MYMTVYQIQIHILQHHPTMGVVVAMIVQLHQEAMVEEAVAAVQ